MGRPTVVLWHLRRHLGDRVRVAPSQSIAISKGMCLSSRKATTTSARMISASISANLSSARPVGHASRRPVNAHTLMRSPSVGGRSTIATIVGRADTAGVHEDTSQSR